MAISIWAYAERRVDGEWQSATELVPNPDFYSSEAYPEEEPCPCPERIPEEIRIGDSRIFAALLINERRAWSERPIAPIVSERGFPDDACSAITAHYQSMIEEDIAHTSWMTLRELSDFDWDGTSILRSALVSAEDAAKFGPNQVGLPDGVSEYWEKGTTGCRVSWTQTYREAFGPTHLAAILGQLRGFGDPDSVRLIVWSDR